MDSDCTLLADEMWAKLSPLLPGQEWSRGVTTADTRGFIEAVSGTPDQGAEKLNRYMDMGFRAFIFSDYPLLNEADYFARYVLPRLSNVSIPDGQGRRPAQTPLTPLTTVHLQSICGVCGK